MVQLGIDRVMEHPPKALKAKRVGLVSNYAAASRKWVPTIDLLHHAAWCEVVALLGPEHGLWGAKPGGQADQGSVDAHTGLPLASLYGQSRDVPEPFLDAVEVLVVDLQDVGARYYTYMNTMALAIMAGAKHGIPVVVLDRPNPIGGRVTEGNIIEERFRSFVGFFPLPNRHGLTMGELARYVNQQFALGADLTVVEMAGWTRDMVWNDTGLPWAPPSPNVTGLNMMLLYPGLGLFEGTNVSVGRGTARPLEMVGAPFIDGHQLAWQLNDLELPGVRAYPVRFAPSSHAYAGEACGGVLFHVFDPASARPVKLGVDLLTALTTLYPDQFVIEKAQTPDRPSHFEALAGTDQLAEWIHVGQADRYLEQGDAWAAYEAGRADALLYPETEG